MYRTRTYIAGDWTGDQTLISQLYKWNNSDYWGLHFIDSHGLTQSRDTSLSCTIKRSLSERLDASKTFVLIVGAQTDELTKGSCQYCTSYNSRTGGCARGRWVDYKSFIHYECEKAKRDGLRIVVIYNYSFVYKAECPEVMRNIGNHINGYYWDSDNNMHWEYQKSRKRLWDIDNTIISRRAASHCVLSAARTETKAARSTACSPAFVSVVLPRAGVRYIVISRRAASHCVLSAARTETKAAWSTACPPPSFLLCCEDPG